MGSGEGAGSGEVSEGRIGHQIDQRNMMEAQPLEDEDGIVLMPPARKRTEIENSMVQIPISLGAHNFVRGYELQPPRNGVWSRVPRCFRKRGAFEHGEIQLVSSTRKEMFSGPPLQHWPWIRQSWLASALAVQVSRTRRPRRTPSRDSHY